jgi:hypothetical protein
MSMNRRLRIRIREYNNRQHNSKRIIIGKLKPTVTKALNNTIVKG